MIVNKDVKVIFYSGIVLTLTASAVCLFFSKICAIVCFALGIILSGIFLVYTNIRYKKMSELNTYLSLVCSGNYDLDISENTEGELSILKNNLYKVIVLLRSQNELLQKDKVYLADSLADISHQLKTPLTSMMVMTDLLAQEADEKKKAEFLAVISTQLEKMRWLILTLLKISKLDADTAEFKNEPVSIKSVVKDALSSFKVALELKEIALSEEIEDFTFVGDHNWSAEALSNIIKNCIEYTKKGGKISISTNITNIYNSICIRDNGKGIDSEDLPHIFDRFYHGKNSSSDSVGIGLALSKTIFEKECCTLGVKSEVGVGTEFEVKFYNSIV